MMKWRSNAALVDPLVQRTITCKQMTSSTIHDELIAIVGVNAASFSPHHNPDDLHDESLHQIMVEPFAVVRPTTTEQVAQIVDVARRFQMVLTPRGSGTGLSGSVTPVSGGIVISFDLMNQILAIDLNNHVMVVQPGLTLREISDALTGTGLHYPVHPGEMGGSIGGNVNTNAGGMRAIRHGVTRHHVLGLELVLANGSVIRTGGPVVKTSSGYDLTQLVIGSEGTLALVTEVTLKLSPAYEHSTTVLVPFETLAAISRVVPEVVASGLLPSMLEYLDSRTMNALASSTSLELGVAPAVVAATAAYLIVKLETRTASQLENDIIDLAEILEKSSALDIYVLPDGAAARLIEARERMFWVAKEAGANEIVDIVVPRSTVPTFLDDVSQIAERYEALITGCGHVGDGNVHLAIFLSNVENRERLMRELFVVGLELGGQMSGEHGIGRDKRTHYLALTDPAVVTLQRLVKQAFDPTQILNPYRILDDRPTPESP
jgi:glycolate oxidase